ncbi:MAG: hypothetical protein QMD22_11585, partial [archaeon]|nr:hypothetical protein [archaeon]
LRLLEASVLRVESDLSVEANEKAMVILHGNFKQLIRKSYVMQYFISFAKNRKAYRSPQRKT